MKIKIVSFALIIFTIYMFNACKDSSTEPEPEEGDPVADSSYFPSENGTYYKYDVERTETDGSQTTGTRSSYYNGMQMVGNTTYQLQVDSMVLSGQASTVSSMYFRKSTSGVFFFLDTTGLAASVPGLDSLLQYITLDSEMRLLLLPVHNNSDWNVFSMNVTIPPLQTFTAVGLKSVFDGTETLTLNLIPSRNVEAVRIKFTISIRLSPFEAARTYTAFGWIAEGIGFVKWQGNGTIIGAFTGNGVDFDDTTSVYLQNITQFTLN